MKNQIEIDGVKYIPAYSVKAPEMGNACIVRSESAGVFFADVLSHDTESGTCSLKNARRLWYWAGAASISQLAVDGTSKPGECKFPTSVPMMTLSGVIEVVPCTAKACASINAVPVWSA